ncbi:shikimate dehydrogenase [Thermanaeromonas sp. C210]|uniref:shikimate dehydrogenase n=1 Tax=Thermanaeromonas sp. C210 TaxID=2731925 RepID=UPI00155BBAEF|nr:shikimate dehydrogenase [Thermanaeromonas sp. C210]GFN23285.1 shikimate dehydrogenase, NADP [Thermanaeromonas sp. C210]
MFTASTRLVGLLGYPVAHSFSPQIHNAAFRALGLDWVYLAFGVEPSRLPAAVEGIRALGFAGANVTIPHKESIMAYLDEIHPLARLIGAVNTVVSREGKLLGYNTDAGGFLRSLEEAGVDPAGKRALILGAGGAARAVAFALAQARCAALTLANRTEDRAQELARGLGEAGFRAVEVAPWEEGSLAGVIPEVDMVINTTSIGMAPDRERVPLDPGLLRPRQVACDIVYNPPETAFLKGARLRGCLVISGLSMLLYQGAEAFTLWTGREAPVEVMREVLYNLALR